ncbi:ThiF family adenylyltransferase [Nonomuraea sp. NPDC049158]|uniref:HesA/MoeB/ThiF family protein n=1 Tax=Nonomuraea sp. NPDC049158 TaxID=3155649 RepID=UPI0033F046D5
MTDPSGVPRHVVFSDSALAVMARVATPGPVRLGMDLRDQGDLAAVAGVAGDDVLVLPGQPADDWVLDEPGPLIVCWADDDGVRAHRASGLGGPLGERIGTSVVPAAADAFERVHGIFETDVLRRKSVAVLGLGSGGSFIVRELAKAGVGRFLLLDHDRLEVGNVSRHECGLADVGRLKANAMRDVVHQHHPAARVLTSALRLSGRTRRRVRDLIRDIEADLVICATDSRESRLLVNRMCLEEGLPLILGGVYRRAYGGVVQRVIPGLTACYQCFVQALPEQAADNEISSAEDAARVSYTDRAVAPQPGLSTDIVPIALHMAKLALLELLDGESPAFATLGADLVAPIHQWINRRELTHAGLEPMGVSIDRQSVLRWYGVLLHPLEDCAVCSGVAKSEDDAYFGGPEPA